MVKIPVFVFFPVGLLFQRPITRDIEMTFVNVCLGLGVDSNIANAGIVAIALTAGKLFNQFLDNGKNLKIL